MRKGERRTLAMTLVAGVTGAILFMPAVYFLGLWLAPARPVPAATYVPPILSEALWARADGGRDTELEPLNPISFVKHRVCRAIDDVTFHAADASPIDLGPPPADHNPCHT